MLWQCSAGAAAPRPRREVAKRPGCVQPSGYLQYTFRQPWALGRCIGGAAEILGVYHSTDHCERFAELAPRHTRAQRVPTSLSEVRCSFCHLCFGVSLSYFSRARDPLCSRSRPAPWATYLICKRMTQLLAPFQNCNRLCNRSVQAGVLRCLQATPCGPAALGTSGLEGRPIFVHSFRFVRLSYKPHLGVVNLMGQSLNSTYRS